MHPIFLELADWIVAQLGWIHRFIGAHRQVVARFVRTSRLFHRVVS